jgi:hypothetical protein
MTGAVRDQFCSQYACPWQVVLLSPFLLYTSGTNSTPASRRAFSVELDEGGQVILTLPCIFRSGSP